MDAFILDLVAKYSWAAALLSVLAVVAVVLPMIFDIFKAIAKATTSQKDDLLVERIEGSKTYKIVLKVLLYVKGLKK